jgi:hypothetical protein
VDDFRVFAGIAGDWAVSLASVGNCGELWTDFACDGGFFGICAGFPGMKDGSLAQKSTVEDGKMCG